jgi:hypothetical protein
MSTRLLVSAWTEEPGLEWALQSVVARASLLLLAGVRVSVLVWALVAV